MAAPKKSSTPARTASKKAAVKKAAPKKTAVKKTAATTTAVKKAAVKKTAVKKTAVKKTAVKKTAAKKTAAVKSTPAKAATTTKTATAKTATAKTAAKTVAKKAATAKSPAAAAGAKKTTSKRAATKTVDGAPAPRQVVPPKLAPRPKVRSGSPLSPLLSNDVPEQVEIPKPRGTSKDGIAYTKDFDVKFLKIQRDELFDRRARELARATRLEDEATSLIEDGEMGDVQFDDEGGEGDTMVVQRDLDRLLSEQARQTVGDIDEALARIEVGTYGYSVVSGKPIPRERLEAIPETTVLAVEKVSGSGFR